MLEKLFNSKTRTKLLNLFLLEPDSPYYVGEIAKKSGIHINLVRRELKNLENLGLIKELKIKDLQSLGLGDEKEKKRKYYQTDLNFVFYPELKNLFVKAQFLLRSSLVEKIKEIGQINLLVLTGFFTNTPNTRTDILIIGRINREKLQKLIASFEKKLEREIYYTLMSEQEFKNRMDLTDRFLFDILENRRVILINNLKLSL